MAPNHMQHLSTISALPGHTLHTHHTGPQFVLGCSQFMHFVHARIKQCALFLLHSISTVHNFPTDAVPVLHFLHQQKYLPCNGETMYKHMKK
jgi:hypothetical protein